MENCAAFWTLWKICCNFAPIFEILDRVRIFFEKICFRLLLFGVLFEPAKTHQKLITRFLGDDDDFVSNTA